MPIPFAVLRSGTARFTARTRPMPSTSPPSARDAVHRRVIVSGEVQGVFSRDACRRVAETHGVTGWVRNLADGRVEAVFEGPPAAVAHLVEWSRHGPRTALVDDVEVHDEEPEHLVGFEIRPSRW